MRIGLAQMDIQWENVKENKKKATFFFEKAAKNQAEVLVFPEMTLTGFSMNVEKTGRDWQEQVHFFEEMSRKYHMIVVFGYVMPVADRELYEHPDWKRYHNRLAIVDNGQMRLNYAKIHPFSYGKESEYFQGGEDILCWHCEDENKDTVFGAFICYDLRFPEVFQISSARSEVIFVIANWPKDRIHHWDCLLQARAIENQCFIVGVNRTGKEASLAYNGHSAIYGPGGELLTTIQEEEDLLLGDIDLGQVKKARNHFPMKKDRRPDIYKKGWEGRYL